MMVTEAPAEAVPFPIDPELTPRSLAVAFAPRAERAGLLREMLHALDDATPAGQRYLMTKVLALFRREVAQLGAGLAARQRKVVELTLGSLQMEAARLAPDAAAFEQRGQMLVDVLSLA
jgi:hypothetical protein